MKVVQAGAREEIAAARELFGDYARELDVDLCFQGFEEELVSLPGKYAPPDGRLLLALANRRVVGCVGLRKIADGVCEMKRLYVCPAQRRDGIGRVLCERVIAEARRAGYSRMVLDTLESLQPALVLYESLGFRRIPAYYANPLPGVVYLGLDLAALGMCL